MLHKYSIIRNQTNQRLTQFRRTRSVSNTQSRKYGLSWFILLITFIIFGFLFMALFSFRYDSIVKNTIQDLPLLRRGISSHDSHDSHPISQKEEGKEEDHHHVITSISYNTSLYIQEIIQSTERLKQHPLHQSQGREIAITKSLDKVMEYIFKQDYCRGKPIFSTMANVFSDLYWQMIENFMYTLVKYNHSSCSLMICVSDPNCMKKCEDSLFPCYNYDYRHYHKHVQELPSALEQIAELKLLHMPKALAKGVDIFVVDLDVGFLGDPMILLKPYITQPNIDIFVQEDISFVMDRSEKGWRTWYTTPLPNIGLFLCRGNKKTVKVFELAWEDYQTMNPKIKHNPGKDQNKVVHAMFHARKEYGLKWQYFSKETAVLLDKIYKFKDQTYELGGEAAYKSLDPNVVIAAHTTCYEQKVKVMGLKTVNSFWNPKYYDPNRRTLTKKLVYTGPATNDLIDEIRSLIYLAIVTKRSLILPNILGDDSVVRDAIQYYKGHPLWPGFRVIFFKDNKDDYNYNVDILESSYYWRIRTGSSYGNMIPVPTIVCISSSLSLFDIQKLLSHSQYSSVNRILLHVSDDKECDDGDGDYDKDKDKNNRNRNRNRNRLHGLVQWADDSVGSYSDYGTEIKNYNFLPSLKELKKESSKGSIKDSMKERQLNPQREENQKDVSVDYESISFDWKLGKNIIDSTRLCAKIFEKMRGNRSCFDKCD